MIIFDIETRPDPAIDVPEFWGDQDINPPANYKDPLKIADYISDKQKAIRGRMSLSPVTGLIACIGVQVMGEGDPTVFVASEATRDGEAGILESLRDWLVQEWNEKDPIITYNGRMFDMPFVAGRLAVHDFHMPFPARRDYRRHVDIYDDVFGREGSQSMWQFALGGGLKEHNGPDLLKLPLAELGKHCGDDLRWLGQLADRTRCVWGANR